MQLSSNNLPGAKLMIWRGFDCCCSINTRIFYIKQRNKSRIQTILMLDGKNSSLLSCVFSSFLYAYLRKFRHLSKLLMPYNYRSAMNIGRFLFQHHSNLHCLQSNNQLKYKHIISIIDTHICRIQITHTNP